jgi:UDP-N-acetylglucosamine 2-epimerase (non-hydrolysing)
MLQLTSKAKFVLTDSGGLQEETSIIGIPCVTMRENTERPITLLENGGTNVLVGNDTNKIDQLCREAMNWVGVKNNIPYWDGYAAERALISLFAMQKLEKNKF